MGLFDRFSNTIFLKSDSELEKEIIELKSIRENVIDKEKIDLDIKKLELGLAGEKQIEYELKSSDVGMYVLHDITLQYEDLTAQIDYFIATPMCVYVVECKNLIGDITVDERGEFIREYYINGKKIKEAIYSPYRQAQRHIELIKKIWLSRKNKLQVLFFEKNFDNWYKPLVVFSNAKGILNINKKCPREIQDSILKIDQLNDFLNKEKNKKKWEDLDTEKNIRNLTESWLEANVVRKRDFSNIYEFTTVSNTDIPNTVNSSFVTNNNENIYSTFDNIKLFAHDVDKGLIENSLKEFRIRKSKEKNLPAYYIFNNEELSKLIEVLPDNIETLENAKILEPVKIKLHGQEIVDIIKNTKN